MIQESSMQGSEPQPVKAILMTSPTNFGVQCGGNPWLTGNCRGIDRILAVQQWSNLRNALSSAGADVIVIPHPPRDCPNAIFASNAGIVYHGRFFSSHSKHPERQAEELHFTNWFSSHNFSLFLPELPETRQKFSFGGAGDAVFDRWKNLLWYGFGFCSTLAFKALLDEFFDLTEVIVHPLRLVDPRLYRLDMCFCPLDNGMVLWYPGAFDNEAQDLIRSRYHTQNIEVSEEDALNFACNSVSIGDFLVTPIISNQLRNHLERNGITPIQVDLSEFKKSGGSAKCLTLEIVE